MAALADVEFGYQIDCERLEGWSGPVEEKNRILHQLEQRRQRQRDTLNKRVEQLQQRAREIMARGRSDRDATDRSRLDWQWHGPLTAPTSRLAQSGKPS